MTEQTYYRWRKEYSGLRMDQAKRLKDLEHQNARLKKLLAEADKAILREAASPNCWARPSDGERLTMRVRYWAARSSRNAGRARCRVSRGPRGSASRMCPAMDRGCSGELSGWRRSADAMAIGESRRCYVTKGSRGIASESNGCDVARG